VLGLGDVPDPVFAAEMVGPGVAVDPARQPTTVLAPIAGRALKVLPHAFVLMAENGTGVLVHLGIDTVRLEGEGFEVLVDQGSTVTAGTPMVRWDPAAIEAGGRSPVIPICVMDAPKGAVSSPLSGGTCSPGDLLFTWPA
jgi:glucose-specific phosphotransferase system IIA component